MDAFTLAEVQSYGDAVAACQRNARVRFMRADDDMVTEGTLRHVCADDSGNFLRSGQDVREAFVRVTTVAGWECFVPLPEWCELARNGMVAYDG